jgi:hypothetical protein
LQAATLGFGPNCQIPHPPKQKRLRDTGHAAGMSRVTSSTEYKTMPDESEQFPRKPSPRKGVPRLITDSVAKKIEDEVAEEVKQHLNLTEAKEITQ